MDKKYLGNFNGFVFRLVPEDFPLFAGYWLVRTCYPKEFMINTMDETAEKFGGFFSGEIVNEVNEDGYHYNRGDFEIIIPRHVSPTRTMRIIKGRELVKRW